MDLSDLTGEKEVEAVEGAHLAQLAAGDRMSIQHFRIEPGAEVPEHSHEHEQAGFIYQGVLTFLVDGEEVKIEPGDSYVLLSEEPHGVVNDGDEDVKGIDIFAPPRTNPDWAED